jgi:hypothetical protein
MPDPHIEVILSPDGEKAEVSAHEFPGSSCLGAVRPLEQALGPKEGPRIVREDVLASQQQSQQVQHE